MEQYRLDGYLVLSGLFSDIVPELDLATNNILSRPQSTIAYEQDRTAPRSVYDLDKIEPIFADLLNDSRIKEISARLLESLANVHQYKLNPKYPIVGRGWEWHQDSWFMTLGNHSVDFPLKHGIKCIHVAMMVDETDDESGCLKVARGSHRIGVHRHTLRDGTYSLCEDAVLSRFGKKNIVSIPGLPGDCLVFDCDLLHCSDPNRTSSLRRMIYLSLISDITPIKNSSRPDFLSRSDP